MNQVVDINERIISHESNPELLQHTIQKIKARIMNDGDKPYATVNYQLQLVDQLAEFDFGQFILQHQGLNGYWTHYAQTHPMQRRMTGLNNKNKPFTELEKYLLDKAPFALATQQRFTHFLIENKKAIKDGATLACIPCGMMGELLYEDYSAINSISLVGIDLDLQTIANAKELAKEKNLLEKAIFLVKDAWNLNINDEFNLISSNGLSIYESDDEKVIQLYEEFHKALTKDGVLVTSFMTFPPVFPDLCEWDMSKIIKEDLLLQKIITIDILGGAKFQAYRTSEQTLKMLQSVGFKEIRFVYDNARVFPTVVAYK